jgi:16S rRNA (guanine527-N7)-methyltransferase
VDTARIARLLEPFLDQPLPVAALDQISIYIDILLRWNARVNLTAIRDPERIVARHFGESLFLAHLLFPQYDGPSGAAASRKSAPWPSGAAPDSPAVHALDVGSGAGFPGLPLKIWAPEVRLTLIEANHKKAAFLREVSRALTLTNVDVMAERAEILASAPDPPRADVVTLRAVERFETILATAISFVRPKGRLALLIGAGQSAATARLAPALAWSPPVAIPLSNATVVSVGTIAEVE